MQILIHTKIVRVHDLAKNVALHFLLSYLDNHDSSERSPTIMHELSCWVDGLSSGTLGDFYSVLQQALHQPFRFTLEFAAIWRDRFGNIAVPRVPFSPLIIQSLRLIRKVSPQFVVLFTQVATNSLLFHSSPVALATTIKEFCEQEKSEEQGTCIDHLDGFTSDLLHEISSGSRTFRALNEHLQLIFPDGQHPLLRLINSVGKIIKRENIQSFDVPSLLSWKDLATLVRQGFNLVVSQHDDEGARSSKQLESLLPALLLVSLQYCSLSVNPYH